MMMILLTLIVPLLAVLQYVLHAPAVAILTVCGVAVAILAEWNLMSGARKDVIVANQAADVRWPSLFLNNWEKR